MINNYNAAFPASVDRNDSNWLLLISKLDEFDNYVRRLIENLDTLYDYNRCPSYLLRYLGNFLYAGIENWDSDLTKRVKIREAVKRHKFSSTWVYDIKSIIEAFTGISPAYLYNFRTISFWVWDAGRFLTNDLGWNVSRWSASREFPNSKIWNTDRLNVKCVVFIDVNTDTLTNNQWAQLKIEVKKSVPVYMRVYLGYIELGKWIEKEVIN